MRPSQRTEGRKKQETKRKGPRRKERGQNTSGWRRREEKAGQRSEWVQRQAARARGSQDVASGEELGEQEGQAEVQQGHGSHHQGVGSSLKRQRVKWIQSWKASVGLASLLWHCQPRVPDTSPHR